MNFSSRGRFREEANLRKVRIFLLIALFLGLLPLSPAPSRGAEEEYRLSRLEGLSWVILQLKQDYLDPSRIDPPRMLRKILETIERRTPEVEIKLSKGKAAVISDGVRRDFELGRPSTVWELNFGLQPLMGFLEQHLEDSSEAKDIEFAAIDGMLATLDPHSNLLSPQLFREMQLKTQGEFGGLGIRIAIRDGALTIISPMPDTPAARLGLRSGDQIVRIGDQSTVNMPLDEAVSMLRGKAGTKVTIWVMRKGWSEPHKYVITRERIEVHSIESRLLEGGVGYIQIQDFGRHTDTDVRRNLYDLKRQAKGMKGLVLDLRNNAGGLMTAAVKVADLFLEQGMIVATVSYSEDSTEQNKVQKSREEKDAEEKDTEKDLPLVVLVNGGSASASEILAGALKNHNRALLLGEQTFGKGTVQILNERVPETIEGACLKLTVAEYLIPGDISIQEIGVTPDVSLVPMAITRDEVHAFAEQRRLREKDIPAHLRKEGTAWLQPAAEIRYIDDEIQEQIEKEQKEGEAEEPPLDEPPFKEDFQIRLARELLEVAPLADSKAMLEKARPFLAETKSREQAKMQQILEKLKVDWSIGEGGAGPLKASFSLSGDGVREGAAAADGRVLLRLEVTNQGKQPVYRLRAESRCTFGLYDRREFLFGRLGPGETRRWEVPVKIPRAVLSRTDELRFVFAADSGAPPEPLQTTIRTSGLERPALGFSWRLEDGNDNLAEPGENLSLLLEVKNSGLGKAYKLKALLKNEAGKDLFIKRGGGRFELGELAPQAAAGGSFQFEVKAGTQKERLPVLLTVWDSDLNFSQTALIEIPVFQHAAKAPAKSNGWVRARAAVAVRAGPDPAMPQVAELAKGAAIGTDLRWGSWLRVLREGKPLGWVPVGQVQRTKAPAHPSPAHMLLPYLPPHVKLGEVAEFVPADTESVLISGSVEAADSVKDITVWVGDDKVFLQPGGPKPEERMPFEVRVKLVPGPNLITVVARKGLKYGWQQNLYVNRAGGLDSERTEAQLAEEMGGSLILE